MNHLPQTTAVLAAALFGLQCHKASAPPPDSVSVAPTIQVKASLTTTSAAVASLAMHEPRELLRLCRDRYRDGDIRDYSCTFVKQELVGGKLTRPQEIAVRFRNDPYSVDMRWLANAKDADQALYVEGAWSDAQGRPLAWFRPSGAVLKLLVPRIKQPIHGSRARRAARRSIDQFGFERTLSLIIEYTERAHQAGVLELEFVGEGRVDGRPTLVFERKLPFDGKEKRFPDALLTYHIDQEWLVPTACYSYADHDGQSLLGSYVMKDVRFNVGLTDDDFHPDKNGF